MTKGLVRIRLARFGRKNTPLYNIVVTESHRARDSRPIEVLGTYNPIPKHANMHKSNGVSRANIIPWKDVKLDFDRSKYWIGCGAQPSDIVTKLFQKSGILGPEWGNRQYGRNSSKEVIAPRREVYE